MPKKETDLKKDLIQKYKNFAHSTNKKFQIVAIVYMMIMTINFFIISSNKLFSLSNLLLFFYFMYMLIINLYVQFIIRKLEKKLK